MIPALLHFPHFQEKVFLTVAVKDIQSPVRGSVGVFQSCARGFTQAPSEGAAVCFREATQPGLDSPSLLVKACGQTSATLTPPGSSNDRSPVDASALTYLGRQTETYCQDKPPSSTPIPRDSFIVEGRTCVLVYAWLKMDGFELGEGKEYWLLRMHKER